eukprot:gene11190-3248_t
MDSRHHLGLHPSEEAAYQQTQSLGQGDGQHRGQHEKQKRKSQREQQQLNTASTSPSTSPKMALPLLGAPQFRNWCSERIQEQLDINQSLIETIHLLLQRGYVQDAAEYASILHGHVKEIADLSDEIKLKCVELRRRQLQVDGDSVVRVTHYLEEAFGKFKLNNMVVNITYKYEPPNHLTFLFSHFDKSLRLIDNSMSNHIIQWLHRETCQRLIYSMTKQNNKLTDDSNQRGNNSNFTWLNPSTTDSIIP